MVRWRFILRVLTSFALRLWLSAREKMLQTQLFSTKPRLNDTSLVGSGGIGNGSTMQRQRCCSEPDAKHVDQPCKTCARCCSYVGLCYVWRSSYRFKRTSGAKRCRRKPRKASLCTFKRKGTTMILRYHRGTRRGVFKLLHAAHIESST